jgi:4-hydroxy-tetrahydrodipicolinate synthase
VPISLGLIERLLKAYPDSVAGIKDSSGDWGNTQAVLEAFAGAGLDVFPGSETFLLRAMRGGGAGCISATANVNPSPIARLHATWQAADADRQQARLDEIRAVMQGYVMIPALKAAIAHWAGDPAWTTVRPPLVPLEPEQREALVARLTAAGFAMPGLS